MAEIAADSSVGPQSPPSCQVPKAIRETWSPVRPSVVYFMALPPVISVAAEADVAHLGWSAGRPAGNIGLGRQCGRLVCWRPAGPPVAPPRDDGSESRGDRSRQHRGPRALRG